MPKYTLTVNEKKQIVDVDAGTPLLWVLRDNLGANRNKIFMRRRNLWLIA